MARERVFTLPIVADIDGVVTSYDRARLDQIVFRNVSGKFERKSLRVDWTIGRLVAAEFVGSELPGHSGSREFGNDGPVPELDALLTASANLDALVDNIFAQLETEDLVKAGTQADYALTASV